MTEEIFVEEEKLIAPPIIKIKKKRKPLSEEAKEKLRERLKLARESKVLKKKKEKSISVETMDTIKEVEEEVKDHIALVPPAPKPIDTTLTDLQNELNNLKLEKLEALEKKNEKKKNQIAKRKATMERKALERVAKNKVAQPAPAVIRNNIISTEPIDIPKIKKYSTYKKSVWSTLL